MDTDCDKSVLLGGATVYSHHGADLQENYADRIDCRITFRAENDSWKLMLQVDQLDIPDTSYNKVQLCNDALYVYDAKNIFGRAIVSIDQSEVGWEVSCVKMVCFESFLCILCVVNKFNILAISS